VRRGSLLVVGTGIQLGTHITAEARTALEQADEVLYLVADPVTTSWLEGLNPNARSLHASYEPGANRAAIYAAIVDEILARVRTGGKVCAAFYGHPGVFVDSSHAAIRRARSEGFEARMLPGISSEDCLFADLAVDPGRGCQSYEATDFLIRARTPDPSVALVIWQVGMVGNLTHVPEGDSSRMPVLADYLQRFYPAGHEVVLYEASPYAICGPVVQHIPLRELAGAEISPMATLFVPPASSREVDEEMVARLGIVNGGPETA
jgi:uncharacterized protein YabN with tetrapyrrole methylase and pyrophosphatase domain